MRHPNDAPRLDDSATRDVDRVVAALRDNTTFTRDQVAWLMAAAQRWGYDVGYEDGQRDEQALTAIAAAYAHTGSFTGENTAREIRKAAYRRECDAAARLPRPGDYRPVEHDGTSETRVAA